MTTFDPYREVFVPTYLAPERARLSPREFRARRKSGARLPVYSFPPVIARGDAIERFLLADLQAVGAGAML